MNPYLYPTHFVADAGGSSMKCPSCQRVLSVGLKIRPPRGYEREDTANIISQKDLEKHKRSFEHIDNLKLARLLDFGYSFKARRLIPNAGGGLTPEQLVFASPLMIGNETAHEMYRATLTTLWNAVLKFFLTADDSRLGAPDAAKIKTPTVRARQELERFRTARVHEKAGPDDGPLRLPSIEHDSEGRVEKVIWYEAEEARFAWQMTGDPVLLNVRHSSTFRGGSRNRYSKHVFSRPLALFKRTALDRLVEWSTLLINELDREYQADREKVLTRGHRIPKDLLHILMVLSLPHEEGWGRTFGIYGQTGKKRTYLKHQPTNLGLPSVIKL